MLHIHNTDDLKQFGIIPLTGEACTYGLRILCDLTEEGKQAVQAFLGSHQLTGFPGNWNSREGQVASVMLPRSLMFNELGVFLMFRAGCALVMASGDGLNGYSAEDLTDYKEELINDHVSRNATCRIYRKPNTRDARTDPDTGRTVHSFTGRTE